MIPKKSNIMIRYTFIMLIMGLVGLAIVVKAGIIMFAEKQYWQDVAIQIRYWIPRMRGKRSLSPEIWMVMRFFSMNNGKKNLKHKENPMLCLHRKRNLPGGRKQ